MRKTLKTVLKRIIAITLICGMTLQTGCTSSESGNSGSGGNSSGESDASEMKALLSEKSDDKSYSNSLLTVDRSTGDLEIQRPTQNSEIARKDDDIWTVFVYMCASDLESNYGAASGDIAQMLDASASENVRFIIQTGGASEWQNEIMDPGKIQRYSIENNEIYLLDEQKLDSMAKSSTLASFLNWGVENYCSEHMGVIFWNHGGGSLQGVCFDENYNMKSMLLRDMDSALLSVYKRMTGKFDFIGFDACLMGTLEVANVMASYADYMYASEETEPGTGWDYKAIGNALASTDDVDATAVGEVVCDSFYKECKRAKDFRSATLSIIDLSKIDALITSFNSFAKDMYEASESSEVITGIERSMTECDNFGGNNRSEGYTNMVDMAGLVNLCSDYADGAEEVMNCISDAVVYSINGKSHANASGLAIYYPLSVQQKKELSNFSKICTSPYYLSFVDRKEKGNCNSGDTSSYDEDYWWSGGDSCGWVDSCASDEGGSGISDAISSLAGDSEDGTWSWFADYDYNEEEGVYENNTEDNDYFDYTENYEQTGSSPLITFKDEPYIDEENLYCFTLDSDGLENTKEIRASVYQLTDDGKTLLELGETYDVNIDWETGEAYDGFDGSWLSLPDGQNLAIYPVEIADDYVVYTSPIILNKKDTNLRIIQYFDGEVYVDGTWDGIDENGIAGREVRQLERGDVIIPRYFSYDIDTEEQDEYVGYKYKFKGDPYINYDLLLDADYLYSYRIYDTYCDYFETEYVGLEVTKDGETVLLEDYL